MLLEAKIVRSITVAGSWTGKVLHLKAAKPIGKDVAVIVQADNGRLLGLACRHCVTGHADAGPGRIRLALGGDHRYSAPMIYFAAACQVVRGRLTTRAGTEIVSNSLRVTSIAARCR